MASELAAAGYMECSAESGEGVEDMFNAASLAALNHQSEVQEKKQTAARHCILS